MSSLILLNYMIKNIKKIKGGYTIIETMIAISLFLIIVMIGMGSLLNANLLHRKSQDMRSIMDNLSFIMEDMSRNLRTGYDYYCSDNLFDSDFITASSCPDGGHLIAFKSGTDDQQWVYKIELSDDGSSYNISRSIGGESVKLNPEEVKVDSSSGFTVTGAEPNDQEQPFVAIRLIGTITSRAGETPIPFSLQTSVSQRLIDIGGASPIPVPPPNPNQGEVVGPPAS